MKKFLVLYRATQADFEKAMSSTPDEQKAGMDAWMAWGERAKGAIVDMGAPLGRTTKVTPEGASDSRNDIGGFSILQGESKEAVAATLAGHPHFMMGGGWIEVVEMMSIPGM